MKKSEAVYVWGIIIGFLMGVLLVSVLAIHWHNKSVEKTVNNSFNTGFNAGQRAAEDRLVELSASCKVISVLDRSNNETRVRVNLINEACLHG